MGTHFATEADDQRAVVELLCKRVVRGDFQTGELPRDPQPEALKEFYRDKLTSSLVTDAEWEEVCQRVLCWQEVEEQGGRPIITRILSRFIKFPTVERVEEVLGKGRAEAYRAALEAIETDGALSALFPNERVSYPWRKFDMDAAVSVVTDVIAPHMNMDETEMTEAHQRLVGELRARRRERMSITAAEFGKRKMVVRALGIWFPITKDITQWKSDPRTAPIMPEFLAVMEQVVQRMKLVRSYLQHIPRRRLSTRACLDLPANLDRMKAYLKGYGSHM